MHSKPDFLVVHCCNTSLLHCTVPWYIAVLWTLCPELCHDILLCKVSIALNCALIHSCAMNSLHWIVPWYVAVQSEHCTELCHNILLCKVSIAWKQWKCIWSAAPLIDRRLPRTQSYQLGWAVSKEKSGRRPINIYTHSTERQEHTNKKKSNIKSDTQTGTHALYTPIPINGLCPKKVCKTIKSRAETRTTVQGENEQSWTSWITLPRRCNISKRIGSCY